MGEQVFRYGVLYSSRASLISEDAFAIVERVFGCLGATPKSKGFVSGDSYKAKWKRLKSLSNFREMILNERGLMTIKFRDSLPGGLEVGLKCSIRLDVGRDGDVLFVADETCCTDGVFSIAMRDLSEYFRPVYGFAGILAGVAAFSIPLGVIHVGVGLDTKKMRILSDMLRERDELESLLHNLYDINIITDKHEAILVDGLPLSKWIRKSGAGTLDRVGIDMWVWKVPQVGYESIRQKLLAADALEIGKEWRLKPARSGSPISHS